MMYALVLLASASLVSGARMGLLRVGQHDIGNMESRALFDQDVQEAFRELFIVSDFSMSMSMSMPYDVFPSDFPSELPSDMPSDMPSMMPSTAPTSRPVDTGADANSNDVPTASPTIRITTLAPTVPSEDFQRAQSGSDPTPITPAAESSGLGTPATAMIALAAVAGVALIALVASKSQRRPDIEANSSEESSV